MHDVGVVVIGRNEGERLKRCLRSIPAGLPVVYVDSGSVDDSVAFARSSGIAVIELDSAIGFTAARGRNAGWRHLVAERPDIKLIQFVDGDCELDAGWIHQGATALEAEPSLAAVFGRLRERFPEKTIYNRMCDDEWDVPLGIVSACGGIAMFRVEALVAAGGFSDDLIAGEEPDLCLRLYKTGWQVRRIDAEMALHDANLLTFRSWWARARRGGFAYAEHVWRHGPGSIPKWRRQIWSIAFWGFVLPGCILGLAIILSGQRPMYSAAVILSGCVIFAAQVFRITLRKRTAFAELRFAFWYAVLLMLGKLAEFGGALAFWRKLIGPSPKSGR